MAYIRTRKLEGDELLEFQKYVEDIVGGPVSMDKIKIIADENKKILEDAIMALCKEDNSETKWIPVNEKLPEKGEFVVVCDLDREIYTGYMYLKEDWIRNNILAWMPLPEPYKPESEVEE